MKKVKVAYFLGALNRGGTEILLLDVFRNWQRFPYDIIGVHRKGGALLHEYETAAPDLICCTPVCGHVLTYLIKLRKILKRYHISVIHAQMPLDCIYGYLASIGLGIKVITTFHGFDIGADIQTKCKNRLAIRLADKVCFVSNYEYDYFTQHYSVGLKGCVNYNGIDMSKLDKIGVPTNTVNDLSTNRYRAKLCMVGSFCSGRSQQIICRAINVLQKQMQNDFDFYFIGGARNGEKYLMDWCVEYCKNNGLNNVYFLDNRIDIYSLLYHMDGFIYSTVHDTFSIAVVEAMALGLPVVVNDWEVMKEITHQGEWATLYKTEDVEDCADKIKDLLNNLIERKKQAQKNKSQVRDAYSIEKHIQHLTDIYQSVI